MRGVNEPAAPVLRTHHHRLQAVWDLTLGEHFSADNQLRALLLDATLALQAEYAELYAVNDQTYRAVGSSEATALLDLADYGPQYALGPMAADVREPLFISDTDCDAIWGPHPLVTGLPLRSVLITPLERSGNRHTLLVGWKEKRAEALTDDETRYIDFFRRVIVRLLENIDREQQLVSQIITDHLTGLYNRSAMLEQIAKDVSACGRSGIPLAVFYVDLDGFKHLNDTYGHAMGDQVLQEAARRMRAALRKHESAGRVGGDEFALAVTDFSGEEQLAQIAERILTTIKQQVSTSNAKASVTASIGIAVYPKHARTPEDLIECADTAMYSAKRRGGDAFAIYGQAENTLDNVHNVFADALAGADLAREFFLCYQPIVYASTQRPLAVEALIRWLHPTLGMLAPHRFIDASRDTQVLHRLDRWVLESALEKQTRLHAVGRRLTLHINVSEPNPDLFDLAHQSLPDVRMEISENAIGANERAFVRFIHMARDRGLHVGVTNFGAGRLSLSVLANLPLEFVKVTPNVSAPVVETAHRFGWLVIAENVEDMRQRQTLVTLGVDALQGYHICSPLAESDFDSWLEYQQR